MLKFETIGNATLICTEEQPILVTDPWFIGTPYFGSWSLPHKIPSEQLQNIKSAKYVWFSHGHPDHLMSESLELLTGKEILIPDHIGGRIYNEFKEIGLNVKVLKNKTWYQLSKHIRINCLSDYAQDAILLIEIGDKLIINANDTHPRGHTSYIRSVAKGYIERILLKTFSYGDIDMINFFNENMERITPEQPERLLRQRSFAPQLSFWGQYYSATHIIPFSSFHQYQRTDSLWASRYTAKIDAFYMDGTLVDGIEILKPFVNWNIGSNNQIDFINPEPNIVEPIAPIEFGDDWNESLQTSDKLALKEYFESIELIWKSMDFIDLRVGGESFCIAQKTQTKNKGLRFEVPRNSLMIAVKNNVFDDLLIGNFMKTIFVGDWNSTNLDSFSLNVSKIADNGGARTKKEVRDYYLEYIQRDTKAIIAHLFGRESERIFRSFVDSESEIFKFSKKAYLWLGK